jgi:transketolase
MIEINQISMRQSFGEKLLELAIKHPELVVLDADVSSSTQTIHFGKKYPERFFNVGVAEANMVDIAGGLATCGLRPVASAFAIFLTLKATDQVRNNICYNNLPVILVGGYAGLSDSFDGASHQSITDIAIMRAMPNMKVIVPADGPEFARLLEEALTIDGPTYFRICRNESPIISTKYPSVEWGKIQVMAQGTDITIAACGITVAMALEAANQLKINGISAEVLNVSSIKPLDTDTLIQSVIKTKRLITIEEHSIVGGLGGAVSECMMQTYPVRMAMIGLNDVFAETGSYYDLLSKYGISPGEIIKKAYKLINL